MSPGTITKIRETLAREGLYPEELIIDGKIHRFSTNGRRGDKAGYYCFWDHGNDFVAGFFGDWRSGLYRTWHSKQGKKLTSAEAQKVKRQIAQAKEEAEKERQKAAERAARKAVRMLAAAKPATANNPYLQSKKVKPCPGLKQLGRTLLVPIQDIKGNVHGLQKIKPDGTKLFLPGMTVRSHFFKIDGSESRLYVCEGIATGLSIHEATGNTVFCSFNCGNLKPVAQAIREKNLNTEMIIAADNDVWTKGNPGLTKATETARAINAKLVVPEFQNTTTKPTDFNDLYVLEGLEAVKRRLKAAKRPETKNKLTQSEILLQLSEDIQLFHTKEYDGYAKILIDNHFETWPIRSKGFKRWLAGGFYKKTGKGPNSQALADALTVLEARAQFEGEQKNAHIRVAEHGGKIYLDLANDAWQVIEISKEGWQVVKEPPVIFKRTKGLLPLPLPRHDGDISLLREFLNLGSEDDWILTIAWLIQALRPTGPYPILVLLGEQGSAKSSFSEILRSIIDPSSATLRTVPRCEHDLVISANNSWILAFDNISSVPVWLSDAFCRLSTGGGMSTRQLYSDQEEIIFSATRPEILNGISDIVSRHDLADRAIFLTLPPIAEEERKPKSELMQQFYKALPYILGGLLNAASQALADIHKIRLPCVPRMADFALWVTAAEPALPWEAGKFIKVYNTNRRNAITKAIETNLVGEAIYKWFKNEKLWEGTASELLTELEKVVDEKIVRMKGWPKAANVLSRRLVENASFLRALGIDIQRQLSGNRLIKIERVRKISPVPPISPKTNEDAGLCDGDTKNSTARTAEVSPGVGTNPGLSAGDTKSDTASIAKVSPGRNPSTNAGSGDTGGIGGKKHTFSKKNNERRKPDPRHTAKGPVVTLAGDFEIEPEEE